MVLDSVVDRVLDSVVEGAGKFEEESVGQYSIKERMLDSVVVCGGQCKLASAGYNLGESAGHCRGNGTGRCGREIMLDRIFGESAGQYTGQNRGEKRTVWRKECWIEYRRKPWTWLRGQCWLAWRRECGQGRGESAGQ
jgi:hypothetical protein